VCLTQLSGLDINSDNVKGSIELHVYKDGRVEFNLTGIFKNSPETLANLADLLESMAA
jgi:hypothetical protein